MTANTLFPFLIAFSGREYCKKYIYFAPFSSELVMNRLSQSRQSSPDIFFFFPSFFSLLLCFFSCYVSRQKLLYFSFPFFFFFLPLVVILIGHLDRKEREERKEGKADGIETKKEWKKKGM